MAYEDWTTYVEVDPLDKFDVSPSTVTVTSLRKDTDAVLYKDFGAGYWGDFAMHDVDVTVDWDNCDSRSFLMPYGQTNNVIAPIYTLTDMHSANKFWALRCHVVAGSPDTLEMDVRDYSDDEVDGFTDDGGDFDYYLRIARSGNTVTVKNYSDAARTVLTDTVSVTLGGLSAVNYRYIICPGSQGKDPVSAEKWQGWVYNLNLHESATSTNLYVHDGSDTVEFARDDDSPLKLYDGNETIGIELVATDDPDASAFRIYDGSTTKALRKKS